MAFVRACVSITTLLGSVDARSFRKSTGQFLDTMTEEELKTSLLEEIESAYGSVSQRGRLASLEASLAPMFKSLPKNEHGKLGHTTVRYALHRIFVQRHGWYIKGLEPAGQHMNSSSPAGVLKEHVAQHVEELFESRLGGKGFNLHDTAVLAATLEHLIHNEAEGRLLKAYQAVDFSESETLNLTQAEQALDSYMKFYLLSDVLAQKLPDSEMSEVFPGWGETKAFTRDVMKELTRTRDANAVDFKTMTQVVEEVGERFGRFQDGECRQMKNKLVQLGDQDVGRVPLPDFYRSSLNGTTFEFQESPAYLRELGVLDENENVIVPNYVGSHTNCIASSSLYSVCCIDECEDLMGQLEKQIASPDATPTEISSVISGMSSSSVEAPRNLPTKLLNRLDDAAATHGGTVQIHGRLFAQWMHHAFPRECSFPHVSGSFTPVTPDEWLDSKGNDGYATQEEMLLYANKAKKVSAPADEHWIEHEELLVPLKTSSRKSSGALLPVFMVAACLVVLKMIPLDALKSGIDALQGRDADRKSKDLVLPFASGKTHML
jgi:hypothetical protein